jgi:hypothetical protein
MKLFIHARNSASLRGMYPAAIVIPPPYGSTPDGGFLSVAIESGFIGVESRFIGVESRFVGVGLRFVAVESGFTGVELRFVDDELGFVAAG